MERITTSVEGLTSGLTSASQTSAPADPTRLGQSDFLQLMTTQLQNQDPFKPMENGEFLGQMAQFSTVSGIESMNASLQSLVDQMHRTQLSDASAMLGRSVLVPGTVARPDTTGEIRAVAELDARAENVTVIFTDPETFDVLHIQDLGPQPRGRLEIAWPDPPPGITNSRGDVRINVQTGGAATAETHVFARVEGVTLGTAGGGQMIFSVEDYGLVSDLEISAIR